MTRSEDILRRRERVVSPGVGRLNTVVADSGHGARLVDVEGRSLIDLAGGIGVMTVGHGCEPVVAAIREAAGRLLHTCIHVATYESYVAMCEKLVELLPHGGPTKAMLVNTGAEAVENAVKIARQATGRSAVLCYSEAFHGRTLLGMSLTSKVALKKGMGPYAPEVYRLPFPSHYRYSDGLSLEAFVERELRRLRQAFVSMVPAEQVAAILIEPIQGEGGFVPAPPAYLQGLRKICDETGIMLVLDEVQSGFCRTGSFGAYQQLGVVPDLSTWAKAIAGGMPLSAVVGKASVMDKAAPGTLGGTYGGNPVACAAGLATLAYMQEHRLDERARKLGERIGKRLGAMQKRFPAIGDVRGMGAMLGFELVEGRDPNRPATELAKKVVASCLEAGVLVLTAGAHSNVIRLLPPLVITDAEIDQALDAIEAGLAKATAA